MEGLPVIRHEGKGDSSPTLVELKLWQPGVLGFRLFEDRNVRIGILPKNEEILIGRFRSRVISCENVSPAELQVRQRADGITCKKSFVVENFLELDRGFSALVLREIRLTAHPDRVHSSKEGVEINGRHGELIGCCGLQQLNCMLWGVMVQRKHSAKRGKVIEFDGSVLGEALFEVICQCSCAKIIARDGERECSGILNVACSRSLQRSHCIL